MARNVLQMPEILSLIFQPLYQERYSLNHPIESYQDLLRYSLVNKTWYQEAIRYLWTDPLDTKFNGQLFPRALERIEPDRRQFYANLVQCAKIATIVSDDNSNILHTVSFPRLRRVELVVDNKRAMSVPRLRNHHVDSLEIFQSARIREEHDLSPALVKLPVG